MSVKKRIVHALDLEKSVDGEMGTMPISDASEPGMANKHRPSMGFSKLLVHRFFFSVPCQPPRRLSGGFGLLLAGQK
jgi:hypothetical protein